MVSTAMKELAKRTTCPECGATRIKPNPATPHGLCPEGHGRLVRMRAKDASHLEVAGRLPEATRIGRRRFRIEDRDGVYHFSDRSGVEVVDLDDPLPAGWVVAYLYNGASMRIRAFLRIGETDET